MAIFPAQVQLVLHKDISPKQAEQYIRSILSRESHRNTAFPNAEVSVVLEYPEGYLMVTQ